MDFCCLGAGFWGDQHHMAITLVQPIYNYFFFISDSQERTRGGISIKKM
jgi:hypothetical protein